MNLNRRSFFAALAAPFLARFVPKPRPPVFMAPWYMMESTAYGFSHYQTVFLKSRQLGMTTLSTELLWRRQGFPYARP
jgi:hypothetical protein